MMLNICNVSKNKILVCLAVLLLLTMLVASGCGTPDQVIDEGDDVEEPFVKVELAFCHFLAAMHPLHVNILEPFAADVKTQTDGRVEIFIYPANELVSATENFDATVQGVIDIGLTLPAYTPGRFPLTQTLEFPFMFTSPLQANLTAWELMETFPGLRETEYKDVEVLWWGTTDLGHLLMTTPVNTMDDLPGLEIRSPGPVYNDVLKELGATPVSMPVPEVYDAIDRGIVDGTLLPYSTLYSFKLNEVVDNVLELYMYATPLHIVANKDAWAKISPGDQAIIRKLLDEFPRKIGEQYTKEETQGRKLAEEAGIQIVELTPAERARFMAKLQPLIDNWIKEGEAKGLPAREAYEKMQEISAKYK